MESGSRRTCLPSSTIGRNFIARIVTRLWFDCGTLASIMRNKLLALGGALALAVLVAAESDLFPILRSNVAIGKQPGGFYLLPTNQLLRPWGEQTAIKGRPVDIAIDSRQHLLAILNMRSVLLMDAATGTQLAEVKSKATSYVGIAFRPGDREVWASQTSKNGPDHILIAQISEAGKLQGTE